jgi:hypothetical protein
MNLDVNSLFVVTIYVEALLGLLLLFAWVQNSNTQAVVWWGFSDLMRAMSIVLFSFARFGPELDLDRSRQRHSVHVLRHDLDRRPGRNDGDVTPGIGFTVSVGGSFAAAGAERGSQRVPTCAGS